FFAGARCLVHWPCYPQRKRCEIRRNEAREFNRLSFWQPRVLRDSPQQNTRCSRSGESSPSGVASSDDTRSPQPPLSAGSPAPLGGVGRPPGGKPPGQGAPPPAPL